jgi:hypothetical protein
MATTATPSYNNFSTTIMPSSSAQNRTRNVSTIEDYHIGLMALSFLILLCNLFAIQTYKRHGKIRRNSGNVLLLGLAVSDLITGVIYLPIVIFCETQWSKYARDEDKIFVQSCRANFLVANFLGFSTIFHIIALTVEKYLAVLHPFQRLSIATRGTYRKILITVWLLALAFALVPAFWSFDVENSWSPGWLHKFHIYGIAQASVFLGLASVILLYCYLRMFIQIHVQLSSHTETGRVQVKARNDRKTMLIFLMFFTVFIVGWTPWFFFALDSENQYLVTQEVKDFLVTLRFVGAVLNPLLYSFIKNDYKQAVQADVRSLCSTCPSPIGFQRLIQSSTLQRRSNNNTMRCGTLTTSAGNVKLKKIETIEEPNGSLTSRVRHSSQAEDTDL